MKFLLFGFNGDMERGGMKLIISLPCYADLRHRNTFYSCSFVSISQTSLLRLVAMQRARLLPLYFPFGGLALLSFFLVSGGGIEPPRHDLINRGKIYDSSSENPLPLAV